MNLRRGLLLLVVLALSSILAFFLRDVFYRLVIIPLAYILWLVAFYYSFVPQLLLWILLLIFLLVAGLFGFMPGGRPAQRPEPGSMPVRGPVETLSTWLAKSQKGTYFKWQIANRLGRLARRLEYMPAGNFHTDARDESVRRYLEAGLTTSFVDYPRPRHFFNKSQPTPLDLDPQAAVDYLEAQMEMERGRHP